jgi:hypothetical protein
MVRASGPLKRMTPMPLLPGGVEMATIVSSDVEQTVSLRLVFIVSEPSAI